MTTDDERARKRDERNRETIMAMAMIAPTPELIRQVMALNADDDDTTDQNITPTHLPVANVEVNGVGAVKGLKEARILKTVYEKA